MSLKNTKSMSLDQKQEMIKTFVDAPSGQNFGHEVVAAYLGCSPWTLEKMRCNGSELPYTKIGRRVAYKKVDVLEYEKSRTVNCTAQYS